MTLKTGVLILVCILMGPSVLWAAQGVATIKGTADGSSISGEVRFIETEQGLDVEAAVSNVPVGKHGFHIHENGSCEDMGKAAGGHFNPEGTEHGYMPKNGHQHAHLGDMGNINVADDGVGTLNLLLPGVTFDQINGKAVILHEKEDDFGQPTGNAGGRIGCGVIGLAE